MDEYRISLTKINIKDADCVILAVAHEEFKSMNIKAIDKMFIKKSDSSKKVLIEVKGMLNRKDILDAGYRFWRL